MKAPAMIKQTRFQFRQIFQMQKKLTGTFINVLLFIQKRTHPSHKQHSHIQCVIPQLTFIFRIDRLMLEATLRCTGQTMHGIIQPFPANGQIAFLSCFFIEKGQRQQGAHAVHILLWQPFGNMVIKPLQKIVQCLPAVRTAVIPIEPIQRNSLIPIPLRHIMCRPRCCGVFHDAIRQSPGLFKQCFL